MLGRETASEVLTNLQDSSSVLESIVEEMSPEQLSGFIGEMPGDDAADFVSKMEEEQADALLETLPEKEYSAHSFCRCNGARTQPSGCRRHA